MPAYFTPDFQKFFLELSENNNREWFQVNKARYEDSVKKPFQKLVSDLIFAFSEIEEPLMIEPKDAIFRIYRDVRFSKNKHPYKTTASALISRMGRKDRNYPGIYLEINLKSIDIYTGFYDPDKQQLHQIRSFLAAHHEEFRKLMEEKVFQNQFGELKGEKNKRLPPAYADLAEDIPELYHKSFYFRSSLPLSELTSDKLIDHIKARFRTSGNMRRFLLEAIDETDD